MPTRPTQGGSAGTWGTELEANLAVSIDKTTGALVPAQVAAALPSAVDGTGVLLPAAVRTALGGSISASAPSGDTTGATDNAVLQTAITAAAAASRALMLQSGTYYFTNLTFPSNFEMYGAGRLSVLKLAATGAANHPFCNNDFTNGNSNIYLHDFALDGNQANISGDPDVLAAPFELLTVQGGAATPSTDIRIERLYLHDSKRLGIVLYNVQGGYVRECFVDNNQRDGITMYQNCASIQIVGNRIRDCGDDHIGINSEDGTSTGHLCSDILVSHNLILGPSPRNRGGGISIRGGSRITVAENTIDSVCESGVNIEDFNTTPTTRVKVVGNIIRNTGLNGTAGKNGVIVDANNANTHASSTYASITDIDIVGNTFGDTLAEAIALRSNHNVEGELAHIKIQANKIDACYGGIIVSNTGIVTDLSIIGNDVRGSTTDGIISIGTTKRLSVVGNMSYNNAGYGLRFESVAGLLFTGNHGYDGQAVPTQQVGVRLASITGTSYIQNNVAYGNVAGQFSYSSIGTSPFAHGFYGTLPQSKQTVTGSRTGGAALTSLMSALTTLGLLADTSTADAAYRRIYSGKGRLDALVAQTIGLNEAGANGPSGSSGGANVFYFDPADWPANAKLRIVAEVITNATAPASDFTIGLYPITGSAGAAAAVTAALGAAVASSTALVSAPALDTQTHAVSADFTPPTAGFYAIGCLIGSNMAASSSVFARGSLDVKF